jgi:hypothetical protein
MQPPSPGLPRAHPPHPARSLQVPAPTPADDPLAEEASARLQPACLPELLNALLMVYHWQAGSSLRNMGAVAQVGAQEPGGAGLVGRGQGGGAARAWLRQRPASALAAPAWPAGPQGAGPQGRGRTVRVSV